MKSTITLRQSRPNSLGEVPVVLRVSDKGKNMFFSTGVRIKPGYFHKSRVKASREVPRYMELNKIISSAENRANQIINDHLVRNEHLNLERFSQLFMAPKYSNAELYEYVEDQLLIRLNKNEITKSTYRTQRTQISKLKKFREKLVFSDLTKHFVEDYKFYMDNQLGNNENTWSKSLTILKTFCSWAVRDKHLPSNPLEGMRRINNVADRDFLTNTEVDKLIILYEKHSLPDGMQNVLRYFLFACFTGLRFGDMLDLVHNEIKSFEKETEVIYYIEKSQNKTNTFVRIPIIPKALKLLPDGISQYQKVFKVLQNQPTNRYLKEIANVAGINKVLTFHVARYTFGSLALERGVSIDFISKFLGHQSLRYTLKIYTKTNISMLYNEMKKLE